MGEESERKQAEAGSLAIGMLLAAISQRRIVESLEREHRLAKPVCTAGQKADLSH